MTGAARARGAIEDVPWHGPVMTNDRDKTAEFRFYEELNDFLEPARRKRPFPYRFNGTPSVKDAIEAIGVPHTEVELVVVNGESVGWDHHLRDGDRVSVYPVFESIDVSAAVRLRPAPLREVRFVADVHLGKLARLLRMLGFDTVYQRDYSDEDIVGISVAERRIVLTRDRGILKTRAVTHGYWVRSSVPEEQLREVIARFDLASRARPFDRCMMCNGALVRVEKREVLGRLPRKTAMFYEEFFRCEVCGKVYWKGSHYERMKNAMRKVLGDDILPE
jgi:uncharacterized protein with PIN domain/sulfur carrier protein ThiS